MNEPWLNMIGFTVIGAMLLTAVLGFVLVCVMPGMNRWGICGTDECEFRHVVKETWTNFARTGNPSTDEYEWTKWAA